MYDFIGRAKLEITHTLALARLNRDKKREEKQIKNRKLAVKQEINATRTFEVEQVKLEREKVLEKEKAEIRKAKNVAAPKQGTVVQEKTGFQKFQDFADNYANTPSYMQSGGTYGKTDKKNSK